MDFSISSWMPPVLGSALALGIYDLCKKHAVRDNSVMPVLFFATLSGSLLFVTLTALGGGLTEAWRCTGTQWWLLLLKSALVAASWTCVYYALRELPISIAAPIRASSPVWTFFGGLVLFNEIPGWMQGVGMLLIFIGYYCFSVLGKLEGISFRRSAGMRLIVLGTLLGAASALYDKFLLNRLGIPAKTVQLHFSIDLVAILGVAWLVRTGFGRKHEFHWRWSIPATGMLLIAADFLYFYAVSMPEIQISQISLVRRTSCVVTFFAGAWIFRDSNVRAKAGALALILLGVAALALAR